MAEPRPWARFCRIHGRFVRRLKLDLTRLLDGVSAALTIRSAATPLKTDGAWPDITSGQNDASDRKYDSCAAIAPSRIASTFSLIARMLSLREFGPCDISSASRGARIHITAGANIRLRAMPADCWLRREFFLFIRPN
jgi:hypothetical protein